MNEKKKRARDRKRMSRAVMIAMKTDCEELMQENVEENSTHTDAGAIGGCNLSLIDSFEYMEEAVTADIVEAQDSTNDLREEVISANLHDILGTLEPLEPVHFPGLSESNPEVDELRVWAITYNISHACLDKLLSILRKRLLCELPRSSATFLRTRKISYTITEMDDYSPNADLGQFVYFGIVKGLEKCIIPNHDGDIQLIVGVDGLPLSKSGKRHFWPILVRVYYKPDLYKPFVVAVYCGTGKPKRVDEYFDLFIEEINHLQQEGIFLYGKRFNVRLMCFAADTPARAYCKGTKGHGGYSACERCTVYGKRVKVGKGGKVVYPDVDHESRNDYTFRAKADPEHHIYDSPLENLVPRVDTTTIFPLDFMHLVCVGVMKKLLEMWISGSLKTRLGTRKRRELSRRMLSIKPYIPIDFQRKPTLTEWLCKWKATEFRFFLLYCGAIVLRFVLPRNLYRHFLLLHAAFRILCSESLALLYYNEAKEYLKKFVQALPLLYGEQALVINMHNLLHVADDVRIFGCSLNHINCFPFENCLGSIKRVLRTPNKPLEQFCSRKSEADMVSVTPYEFPKPFSINKSVIKEGQIHVFNVTLNCSITVTTEAPNNYVLLNNEHVMQVNEIYGSDVSLSSLKIRGKVWDKKTCVYKYPKKSSIFQIWKLPKKSSPVNAIYPLASVVKKVIKMNMSFKSGGSDKEFLLTMLHDQ